MGESESEEFHFLVHQPEVGNVPQLLVCQDGEQWLVVQRQEESSKIKEVTNGAVEYSFYAATVGSWDFATTQDKVAQGRWSVCVFWVYSRIEWEFEERKCFFIRFEYFQSRIIIIFINISRNKRQAENHQDVLNTWFLSSDTEKNVQGRREDCTISNLIGQFGNL